MTRKRWLWTILLGGCVSLLLVSVAAKAQDDQAPQGDQNDQDPPGRVARLSYAQGSVSFRPGGENDWVTAVPNRPMATGDDLWADEDSRAEAHIGSTAIRLGAKTGITFLAIDDRTTQIRLAQGSLILRVRHVDDDDTYEVDTPNLAFTLLQPGDYRVDVSADGNQTFTTVWHGRGRVTGGGFSHTVLANQSASFTGTDNLNFDLGQLPEEDDFDRWSFERDDREDQSDSANYVSREMTGYEDLDEYGEWSYVAGYGQCWRPRAVVVGWAPYRFGHWLWVGPWGWTWVEDEPWGFAPFHYGRWASVGGGWFWVPGPVVVRPVWAPALVAFVGGGPGFRFSVGAGVAWFPLAPGEVFVPGYRVSRAYLNNVNITNTNVNITRITNVYNTVVINKNTNVNRITYVNQHVNGGVTVVSHNAFVNARPVAQNTMRVDRKELEAAPVSHIAPVEPVRASVLGAGRAAPVRPPAAVMSRQVVAQKTPPPPPRPLEQRQAQAGGRLNQQPLVRQEMPRQETVPQGTQSSRSGQPNRDGERSQEGFRPFTQPNSGNNQVRQLPQPPPRTMEEQGTPPPENRSTRPAEGRNEPSGNQNSRPFTPPQREAQPQATHPLVRPAPAEQERSPQQEREEEQKYHQWQQQRPAAPPPQRQESRPTAPLERHENPRPPESRSSKPNGH
jgi:hypothetical protein